MKSFMSGLASVAGALLAHVPCCGLNIALLAGSAGTGATWLAGLTPYRPWFLGFSLLLAGLTLWLAFRPVKHQCTGDCVPKKMKRGLQQGVAVTVAVLSLGSIFLPASGHSHHHDDTLHATRESFTR